MILADKYNIPYLYLPWLVNTMKGMTLCEGPALFNIANTLLSNTTLPITIFVLTTFFLYGIKILYVHVLSYNVMRITNYCKFFLLIFDITGFQLKNFAFGVTYFLSSSIAGKTIITRNILSWKRLRRDYTTCIIKNCFLKITLKTKQMLGTKN